MQGSSRDEDIACLRCIQKSASANKNATLKNGFQKLTEDRHCSSFLQRSSHEGALAGMLRQPPGKSCNYQNNNRERCACTRCAVCLTCTTAQLQNRREQKFLVRSLSCGDSYSSTQLDWFHQFHSTGLLPLRGSVDLAIHACTATANQLLNLLQRRHGGVAWRCHCQRTVGGAILHSLIRSLAHQQTVDEARSEAVTTADAVVDPKIAGLGLVELSIHVDHSAPAVHGRRGGFTESRGHTLEVRVVLDDLLDHSLEGARVQRRQVLIHAIHVVA